MKKILLGILTGFSLFLINQNDLLAQNWERDVTHNNWGDITGYYYIQGAGSAIAHGDRDVTVFVGYMWRPEEAANLLIIHSQTLNSDFHPAASSMDSSITLSLRDNNGQTSAYGGIVSSKIHNYNMILMYVEDFSLIDKLHGEGQWELLIEGDGWYIRSRINGSLPNL